MKNDTVEIAVKIEIPTQTAKYLCELYNKSESTECNDFVVSIKPNNNITIKTVSDDKKPQSNTDWVPSYRMYDTNPELFLNLYNKYMNHELTVSDIANLLGCTTSTFRNAVRYYRDKENVNKRKRHINNMNLAKYNIYDEKPEEFLEVYNKYMNDELSGSEAAKLLHCSTSTFNNAVRYYRDKENLDDIKYCTKPRIKLAKYTIYDTNPELFLKVYTKFMNKKITAKEAAKELDLSVNTFYRSIKYYESKTGIENFG